MNQTRELRKPKTVDDLANLFFEKGAESARDFLSQILRDRENYSIVRAGQGVPNWRTLVRRDQDGIEFFSYNPPAFWQTPYSILKARFTAARAHSPPNDSFMYHSGEELLVPTTGR